MKKTGILNAELIRQIAALGHQDTFLIGDVGMPVPKGVPVIDLAVCLGVPTFEVVLDAILEDTQVEFYTLATEIDAENLRLLAHIQLQLSGVPCEKVPHEILKRMSQHCKFAVRTGEASPYPNIILRSGVTF